MASSRSGTAFRSTWNNGRFKVGIVPKSVMVPRGTFSGVPPSGSTSILLASSRANRTFHVEHEERSRCLWRGISQQNANFVAPLSSRRHGRLFRTDQEISPQRLGYRNRLLPLPMGRLTHFIEVPAPDPEQSSACRQSFGSCPIEKGAKFAEGSRADIIEWSELFVRLLVATDQYPRVCELQLTNNFRQERALFYIRFH